MTRKRTSDQGRCAPAARGVAVVLWALGLAVGAGLARAESSAGQAFAVSRAAVAPELGSDPGSKSWQVALRADRFYDLTARKEAALDTTAYLTYDDVNLYVAFDVAQSDVPVRASQTSNGVGFGIDDFVGIGIDTSGNGARVELFALTPLGTRYQQSSESSRFDPAWRGAARTHPGGWTATMIIPLTALGGAGNASAWRFNFIRGVAAVNEHYTWAYNPQMFDGVPPAWPYPSDARFWPKLAGLHFAGRRPAPRPYAAFFGLASMGSDRNQFPQTDGTFATEPVRPAGLDAVYPVTSTARFVGTFHPDFSNVEVDQQTIAPQQFQRALGEYRPFFARGAQYLHPSAFTSAVLPVDQIFYTPAIGVFNSGVKVEGTQGLSSFGVLNVSGTGFGDSAYGYKYATADRSLQAWSDGAAARSSNGVDNAAEVGTQVRNVRSGLIAAINQATEWGSFIADAPQARSTNAFVDSQKPNFETYFGYRDEGPLYNPRSGLTTINDIRGYEAYTNFYGTASAGGALKTRGLFFAGDRFVDRSGAVRQADFDTNLDLLFTSLLHVNISQATSETRSYASGYPVYAAGLTQWFNQEALTLGYREGSSSPVTASISAGPFGGAFVQQYAFSTARQIGARSSILFSYGATRQAYFAGGNNGQYLRRFAWSRSLGPESTLTLSYRDISGTGGYATPGANFAALYHRRFANRNDLFVTWGTPASPTTLDRLIIKYVWQLGQGD